MVILFDIVCILIVWVRELILVLNNFVVFETVYFQNEKSVPFLVFETGTTCTDRPLNGRSTVCRTMINFDHSLYCEKVQRISKDEED